VTINMVNSRYPIKNMSKIVLLFKKFCPGREEAGPGGVRDILKHTAPAIIGLEIGGKILEFADREAR